MFHVYMLLGGQQDRDIDWSETESQVFKNNRMPFSIKNIFILSRTKRALAQRIVRHPPHPRPASRLL